MKIVMPKGTAAWLLKNTRLTIEQIADFCSLHIREVNDIFREHIKILPVDPVKDTELLTEEEIKRCEEDPLLSLQIKSETMQIFDNMTLNRKKQKKKYIYLGKRGNKRRAITWMLKYHPYVPHSVLVKMLNTTMKNVSKIASEPKTANDAMENPVSAGLCNQFELQRVIYEYQHMKKEEDNNLN